MGLGGGPGDQRPPTPEPAASPTGGEGGGSRGTPEGEAPRPLARSEPAGLAIPALGLEADEFVALGLRSDGEIEVPADTDTVGWHENGPWPGQGGPAVLAAHVDSATGPAVFHRIGELRPGDEVAVTRADRTTAVFTVDRVEQYAKEDFPTRKVYGPTGGRAELRLVTCGGDFSAADREYRDNIVVYAALAAASPAD